MCKNKKSLKKNKTHFSKYRLLWNKSFQYILATNFSINYNRITETKVFRNWINNNKPNAAIKLIQQTTLAESIHRGRKKTVTLLCITCGMVQIIKVRFVQSSSEEKMWTQKMMGIPEHRHHGKLGLSFCRKNSHSNWSWWK